MLIFQTHEGAAEYSCLFSELMKNRFYVNGKIIYERKNLF